VARWQSGHAAACKAVDAGSIPTLAFERAMMKIVKTYSTKVDADLARIALEAAGVPSRVVGIDVALQGGAMGVQLLVPDEYVETARTVLEGS
jgi:Putative prokaryotic signal transducing protein